MPLPCARCCAYPHTTSHGLNPETGQGLIIVTTHLFQELGLILPPPPLFSRGHVLDTLVLLWCAVQVGEDMMNDFRLVQGPSTLGASAPT